MTADTTTALLPSNPPADLIQAMAEAHEASPCHDLIGPMECAYRALIDWMPAAPSSLTAPEREYLLSRVTSELADYSGDQRHMTKHEAERMELLRGLADKLLGGAGVAPEAGDYSQVIAAARRIVGSKVDPRIGGRLILEADVLALEAALRSAGEGK